MEIDLRGTKIEINKVMKADPRRIGEIHLQFHFPETLSVNEKERIIFERAAKTCPVIYSINPEIKVEIVFNWREIGVSSL